MVWPLIAQLASTAKAAAANPIKTATAVGKHKAMSKLSGPGEKFKAGKGLMETAGSGDLGKVLRQVATDAKEGGVEGLGGMYLDMLNSSYGLDIGGRVTNKRQQGLMEQQAASEYARNEQGRYDEGMRQEQRVQDAEALGVAQRATGQPTGAGQGFAIGQMLESGMGLAGAQGLTNAGMLATQQANEANRQSLARNGFSAGEIAEVDLKVRTLARGAATIQELNELSTADVNLVKGGGAAKAKYMAGTLEPALMTVLQTGVITPGEQPRIDRFNIYIDGWKGATTWGTTQQAQLNEMSRWFKQQAHDMGAAYQLDSQGYMDSFQPRTLDEQLAEIASFDTSAPTPEELAKLELEKVGPPEGGGFLDTPAGNIGDALGRGAENVGTLMDELSRLAPGR